MKSFEEKPQLKPTPEKQIVKEAIKESGKVEKHEKNEKPEKEKHEKEKNEKEIKEHKEQKEAKEKQEKEKNEKHEKSEKEKTEKEHKEFKDRKHEHKEGKEKEHGKEALVEKVQKEIETPQTATGFGYAEDPQSQAGELMPAKAVDKFSSLEKLPEKTLYHDKPIHKEIKIEKLEHKEFKLEKIEHKEWDKYFEIGNIPGPGPVEITAETRLAALEATMAQLMHFIPENLRPDLSQGALKSESTTEPTPADAPAPTSDKPEPTSAKDAEKGKKS